MTELFCEKLNEDALRALPVLTLAHVGDGVYELLVRSHVVRQGAVKVADMHRQTVALVSAPAQAKAAKAIVPLLTEAEKAVFQRGRNTRLNSIPKHATLSDYSYATALEALLGMLYLSGRNDRIAALWDAMLQTAHEETV